MATCPFNVCILSVRITDSKAQVQQCAPESEPIRSLIAPAHRLPEGAHWQGLYPTIKLIGWSVLNTLRQQRTKQPPPSGLCSMVRLLQFLP
jgi:hypothetical protein